MIRALSILSALIWLMGSTCEAELEWIFHPRVPGIDGPSPAYVTATLESGPIRYEPPHGWTVSGSRFIVPGKTEADAFAEAVTIKGSGAWTAERTKALRAYVLARMAPKNALGATIVSEGVMAIDIAGRTSYEVCFSYGLYGQAYTESVVFTELGNTQLRFHFGCLREDFAALHPVFTRSLRSVQGIDDPYELARGMIRTARVEP
jgi:hypothetical protein